MHRPTLPCTAQQRHAPPSGAMHGPTLPCTAQQCHAPMRAHAPPPKPTVQCEATKGMPSEPGGGPTDQRLLIGILPRGRRARCWPALLCAQAGALPPPPSGTPCAILALRYAQAGALPPPPRSKGGRKAKARVEGRGGRAPACARAGPNHESGSLGEAPWRLGRTRGRIDPTRG
jgi:hypothetical protein